MYITLDKLVFNVTKACPGRCAHCQIPFGQDKAGVIDADQAARALAELHAVYPVDSVLLFGGEPMLYPERVYTIVRAAREAGIPGRDIISNGLIGGSADPANARRAGHLLAEAGIVSALVSADGFHAVNIPFETVYAFLEGLLEAGVNARLHPAWVLSSEDENPYNVRTREVLKRFSPLHAEVSKGNVIFPSGRAAKHLGEYFTKPDEASLRAFRCGQAPYTSPLDHVWETHIDPNGDVMVCGFAIGNIHEKRLVEIVESYDPHENEQMETLMRSGPYALYENAVKRGLDVDIEGVYSGCELCARTCEALRGA